MQTITLAPSEYRDSDDNKRTDGSDERLLRKRRDEFQTYATVKFREIDEARLSWRYYHADQWTPDQLKVLKKRGQPAITFDRTGRKLDSLVGTIRKLRTDCKCYPNTPQGEAGAEVATQVIRTICDASLFEDLETECCRDASVQGIGVSELMLEAGDQGDPDLRFEYRDPKTWFYDTRSVKPDFSDSRFHGIYKWADIDELEELAPGTSEELKEGGNLNYDDGYWTAFDTDRELMWRDTQNRVRLVDHWYIEGGVWKWCLHAGTVVLMKGDSPFYDSRNKSISKYFAFANQIDVDGDHYGFVRRMRGPQDAMNQHRSKAIHIMNTRQLKVKDGAVDDIEVARREAARPDGVLSYHGDSKDLEVIQPEQEFIQQTNYYQDAKAEIDNFGPNQALVAMGQNTSGRAYNMAQQAGLSELGPFLKNFRMWKLAQYRAAWCAAQRYWTSQRFLRVTGDQELAQFMMINGVELDQWGRPQLVNALGQIDVDIHIGEGPDTETVMGDVFDTLMALAQNNVPVPPQAIIEASYLPASEKKKLNMLISQPNPVQQAAQAAQIQKTNAEAEKLHADAGKSQTASLLNLAKARTEGQPGAPPPPQTPLDIAEKVANIRATNATAAHKMASVNKMDHDALMAPLELIAEHVQRRDDRVHDTLHKNAGREQDDRHKNADREAKKKEPLRSFRPPL
jgi:hypothetical protein